jgi:hypothetical protein
MHRERVRTVRRSPRRPLWKRRRFWLPVVGILFVLAVVSAVRYYQAVSAMSDGKNEVLAARQLLTGDLSHLDATRVAQAQADLDRAAGDFGAGSQLLADGWLSGIAQHLPWLSTQVNGALSLRAAGSSGVRLGQDVLQVVQTVLPGPGASSGGPLPRLVSLASHHPDLLARAGADVGAFRASLAGVPSSPLFGPLESARKTLLSEGQKLVTGAGPALQILQAIPAAIGQGTHTYLVLIENPGEERPSGGYIGAVGQVSFTNGAISSLSFKGSEYYKQLVRTIFPPTPLAEHLFGAKHWELGDANWSADFPTAMAEVELFYKQATGTTVDGDISIDPVALSYVLSVVGPVHVPPYPQVLTAANVLRELNYITNSARPQDPGKVYLPPFGELMTRKLLQAPVSQMPKLASALQSGAEQKHIALYFHDQALENLVNSANFGGHLTTPTSDSVLVDDANLSGTKGDLFVTRSYHLAVKVDANGNAQDQLTLSYINPRVTNPADLKLLPNSGADYRDYIRVYVPEAAQLSEMTVSIDGRKPSVVSPEVITYEFGQESIAYWLVVPFGGTGQVTITYAGPFADISVTPERYALQWLKQVNSLHWPVSVAVTMPNGRTMQWSSVLSTDRQWAITGP